MTQEQKGQENLAPEDAEPVIDQATDNESPATTEMTLEQALEALEAAETALAIQKEDVLRVQAEMQNLRRRTEQDIEKAHKYGQEKFSSELLVVIDNLERALQAVTSRDDELLNALCDGVELTLKSFLDCFRKFNIEQIDPLGEPFNPQLHQAVVMQESADAEPDTVLMVMQKGYTLHGRVLRPAMVIVSKAPSPG